VIRSTLLIFFISLLFVGTIGVPVFTHTCQKEGKFTSYFLELNDHCENKVLSDLPSCCQKVHESEKEDCCNDETEVFKLKVDYVFFWYDFSFQSFQTPENPYFSFDKVLIPSEQQTLQSCNSDPPPKLCGREILLKKQVLII
jgi:uncharacterized protein YcfL